jgi:hypothetical protein
MSSFRSLRIILSNTLESIRAVGRAEKSGYGLGICQGRHEHHYARLRARQSTVHVSASKLITYSYFMHAGHCQLFGVVFVFERCVTFDHVYHTYTAPSSIYRLNQSFSRSFVKTSNMHLMYYLDSNGKRVYTLKVSIVRSKLCCIDC